MKSVVAHIPYLVNLASSDKEIRRKSIERLMIEISRAEKFGVPFLVLHPGSFGKSNKKGGIERIIEALNIVSQKLKDSSVKILLETMAGQGTMLGSCFEEIDCILKGAGKSENFGVCFDTGHVFMAGYDIRGYEGYEKVLKKFNKIIGIDKIQVFHLNDSKTKLGSKSDRHACIGEGELGRQVFHAILRDQKFLKTPKILEIPERDEKSEDNLEILRKLQAISGPVPETKPSQIQLILEGLEGAC